MKKIIYTAGIFTALSLGVFTSCKKDTVAFPAKPQSSGISSDFAYVPAYFPTVPDADGIFISAKVFNEKTVIVSPFINSYEYGMAKYTTSAGNFNTLTDIGSVTLNDSTLVKGSDLSYLSSITNYSLNLSNQSVWQITNSTLPSFTYKLNGVFPSYSYIITSWDGKWQPIYPRSVTDTTSPTYLIDLAYNNKVQYSIPISQYALNADTVVVTMIDASGFTYSRKVAATDSVTSFKPNDFFGAASFDLATFNLQISSLKYQDTTVNGKNLYFLKMASYIKYYAATK